MRTSRMSRDTASVLAALTPRRSTRRAVSSTSTSTPIKPEERTVSPESGTDSEAIFPIIPSSASRKRKRANGTAYPTTSPKTLAASASTSSDTAQPVRRARRQPAKQIKAEDGTVTVAAPPNWEVMYTTTAAMRKQRLAAVDTMGCESLAEDSRPPIVRRFQTLVALMLSSQTKDTVTSVAMQNLQRNLPGGLTLEAVLDVEPALFNSLIDKVGFHNNKTKYIKATAIILRDDFAGDIPDTIEGLVSLPGVGPKMAYLTMSAAWGRDEGIGVDVHVHRITNLWGWHKTRTPEETRAQLESWLPRDKWHDINTLLVGFGQTWCPPVGRKCNECTLGLEGLCPSAVIDRKTIRAKREVKIEKNEVEDVHVKTEITDTVGSGLVKTEEAVVKREGEVPDIEDVGKMSPLLVA